MSDQVPWAAWKETIAREDVDALEVLATAAMYERYFQEVQSHAVKVARAQGRSWQAIADAVGTTKQTAWQKWRTPKEKAEEMSARFPRFPVGDWPDLGQMRPLDSLVQPFDPLVQQVVDSWCTPEDATRPDLVEAARTALEKTVTSYDTSGRSVPFVVYATWWMRQAVMQRRNELRSEK
jgi:hypothetical protein